MNHHRTKLQLVGQNIAAKSTFFAIVVLCLATTSPTTLLSSPVPNQKGATFDLFRIVEKQSNDLSERLQSVKITERGRSYVVFTERDPAFKIPLSEIVSITIERENIRGWKAKEPERDKGKVSPKTKNEQPVDTQDGGFVYKATFIISKSEKKRLDEFANANGQQALDFRFGNRRLGTVQFVGRFGGVSETKNEFATFLEATNVKEVFGSLKDKVIWK
jgi:hypothetical protein